MTQPGQPYQPNNQPPSWQNPTRPPAQGYPEPGGNYLGMQQAPPPGAYPQQVATGLLRIHLQGSVMTSSWVTPTLLINNQVVKASYGPNDYVLPAGQYRIGAYAQWMRQYGQAALDVVVYPGQTVEVFYAAPLHQFTTGSIGFSKQSRKGMGFFVVVLGLVAVFIVAMLALGLLAP